MYIELDLDKTRETKGIRFRS